MAMGAGVRGNRVVGGTDDHVEAQTVNPQTLLPEPGGLTLTPEHVHVALRRMAGIDSQLDARFGINAGALNLFA